MTVKSLFTSLIAKKSRDEVLAEYLAALKSVGFPTASWYSTSVPLRLLTAMAGTHAKFTELLEAVTKGGYLELATGAWLTLLALSFYRLERYPATKTVGGGKIKDVASAGPFNIAAGQLRFATASGKIFLNSEAFTVELDETREFVLEAIDTGAAYNAADGDIVRMLTPLPGLGFATGETSFNPGPSWITSEGTDEESDPLLRQRCRDQWVTLGYGANADWYRYYVRSVPTYGALVTRVKVQTDPLGTGTVTVIVAGPSGGLSPTTVAGLDEYMQKILMVGATLHIQSAVEVEVTPVGTAYAYSDFAATALGSIEDSLQTYLGSVDIGETAYLTQIVDAVQYDSDEVRNAALTAPTGDVVLAANEVPKLGSLGGLAISSLPA